MSIPPRRTAKSRLPFLLPALLLAAGTLAVGTADAGPATPVPLAPGDGSAFDALPAFAWQPVAGADRYEFELSADPGFNSKVAASSTRNTRASVKTVLPNGEYFWRVRAVTAGGDPGAWSGARGFRMAWTARPSLLTPANNAVLSYPNDPFRLSWTAVPGASEYLVRVATDPSLGNLIWSTGPQKTASTTLTLSAPLAAGTYYWGITPLNAEGHAGAASTAASFRWEWPSTTTLSFTDLADAPEMFDPYFSWQRVPGAAGYEVEVSTSSDWATSSKVCCAPLRLGSPLTTLGLSLAPQVALDNNTYYWRVRAVDPSGNAGAWNVGPSFTKTFANVPAMPPPSVKNLRMRDNLADPYDGVDPAAVSFPLSTGVPIVTWNPVPGASSYQVDVTPHEAGACDWTAGGARHWTKVTSTTAWTPLGWSWAGVKPYPNPATVSTDGLTALVSGGRYCVRVRPIDRSSTAGGPTVYGDWTYLPQNNVAAFEWTGPPPDTTCSPCVLAPSDYRLPLSGSTVGRMPLFTWQPITGADSYFVIVARDPNFTNVIDYAFTRIPAYAPRTGTQTKGYPDELTEYYWSVLPAREPNGGGVSAHPLDVTPPGFHKQSVPPTRVAPAAGAVMSGPTTFRWTPVDGARRYRLEVAQDANFSNLVESAILTDSTAFVSNTTYPADTVLYWRVRADAEDSSDYVGLTWSSTGTFQKQLPAPVPDPSNPTAGAAIPTLVWSPVPGAVSYDMHVEEPDGDRQDFSGLPSHAASFKKMTGVGIFKFQVRAAFPTASGPLVKGPYSPTMSFTRTIPEPGNASADVGPHHVLFTWSPRQGAKHYRVQASTRGDFSALVDNTTTQAPNFAPQMTHRAYVEGGRLYWRVAAVDADNNVGDWSKPQELVRPQTMRLRASGFPTRGRKGTISVSVTTSAGGVPAAAVRLWGAGVAAKTKRTSAQGRVTFTVTPRKRGRIFVTASKAGFVSARTSLVVRAR